MLEVEYLPIDELKPYAGNAKRHPAEQIEQIKKSIMEFGFRDPIGIWNGEVVEGHGRLIAARELDLPEVPVIRLDDMTDAQRRAYTLVHNKLTMNSDFDADLLSLELIGLEDEIDMSEYGFDADDIFGDEDDGGYYGDERERTIKTYNLQIASETEWSDDFWQMPVLRRCDYIPDDLIGFNYAKTSEDKSAGIHFYIDDYQFERLWNDPEKYVEILAPYSCILTPDFSLYMDMPMPTKIWNTYRSRQVGAYYQQRGLRVIPTLSWAEAETFEFCFRGIEKGSVVSVSTIGVKRSDESMEIWQAGMREAIKQLEPSTILEYGGDIGFEYGDVPVKRYSNQVTENWHKR